MWLGHTKDLVVVGNGSGCCLLGTQYEVGNMKVYNKRGNYFYFKQLFGGKIGLLMCGDDPDGF